MSTKPMTNQEFADYAGTGWQDEGFTVILNITPVRAGAEPGDLKDALWEELGDLDGFTVDRLVILP